MALSLTSSMGQIRSALVSAGSYVKDLEKCVAGSQKLRDFIKDEDYDFDNIVSILREAHLPVSTGMDIRLIYLQGDMSEEDLLTAIGLSARNGTNWSSWTPRLKDMEGKAEVSKRIETLQLKMHKKIGKADISKARMMRAFPDAQCALYARLDLSTTRASRVDLILRSDIPILLMATEHAHVSEFALASILSQGLFWQRVQENQAKDKKKRRNAVSEVDVVAMAEAGQLRLTQFYPPLVTYNANDFATCYKVLCDHFLVKGVLGDSYNAIKEQFGPEVRYVEEELSKFQTTKCFLALKKWYASSPAKAIHSAPLVNETDVAFNEKKVKPDFDVAMKSYTNQVNFENSIFGFRFSTPRGCRDHMGAKWPFVDEDFEFLSRPREMSSVIEGIPKALEAVHLGMLYGDWPGHYPNLDKDSFVHICQIHFYRLEFSYVYWAWTKVTAYMYPQKAEDCREIAKAIIPHVERAASACTSIMKLIKDQGLVYEHEGTYASTLFKISRGYEKDLGDYKANVMEVFSKYDRALYFGGDGTVLQYMVPKAGSEEEEVDEDEIME